ncbi:MAG: hypothetical protein OSA89_20580 [Mariniblastus sp.]|nr:hypothetical protein [Mariniblastus sp.]
MSSLASLVLVAITFLPVPSSAISAGPFRGFKTQLYEGGIRCSLVAWGPGLLEKNNHVDRQSVFLAIDLVPTLLNLTNSPGPDGVDFDGESLPGTLLGKGGSRQSPIFFRRPPDRDPFYGVKDLPDLAMRDGEWKFLCEYDGSEPQLYDMYADRGETKNLADQNAALVGKLSKAFIAEHQSMPSDKGAN